MRLTRFSDIGLRALMYLGACRETVSSVELADRLNVSREHLRKSVQALERLGVLSSTRGRHGGYALAQPAGTVRIGAVLRELEVPALVECFGPDSTCPLTGVCPLASALEEAQAAFYAVLDQYALEDLLMADGASLTRLGLVQHDFDYETPRR